MRTLILGLLLLSACATPYRTAQKLGCPVDEIELSDFHRGYGFKTYRADCRGKTFYCIAEHHTVSCTRELGDAK